MILVILNYAHATDASVAIYPDRPGRLVIAQIFGCNAGIVGRELTQGLSEGFGQQFVVDIRGGANGTITTEMVVRAAPGGCTSIAGCQRFWRKPKGHTQAAV